MNIIEKKVENNIILDTNDNNNVDNEVINTNIDTDDTYKPNNNKLFSHTLKRGPSCGLIVVDNFYNNAMDTRKYILSQEFSVIGNYPGKRTVSYATEHLKEIIQKYVEPFAGKII